MSNKVVAIIQVRLGSTRLPGKALMDLGGRPMIAHVIERAKAIDGVDEVVLNCPAEDVASFIGMATCPVFGVRDQQKDVLGSYLDVARQTAADTVVRLTGDCPFLDPELCRRTVLLFKALDNPLVYCANDTLRSGYPDGTDVEVTSIGALRTAAENTVEPFDREHVMPWIRRHLPIYGILAPMGVDLSQTKWSVDTKKDLVLARMVYSQLQPGQFDWQTTLAAWKEMV